MKYSVPFDSRGLHFVNGIFKDILGPGKHSYSTWFAEHQITLVQARMPRIDTSDIDLVYKSNPDLVSQTVRCIKGSSNTITAVYADGNLKDIFSNDESRYYWCDTFTITIEEIDPAKDIFVAQKLVKAIKKSSLGYYDIMSEITIPAKHTGLLFVDNEFHSKLEEGSYAIWKTTQEFSVFVEDKRPQELEIIGQEFITKDKVTMRFNGVCEFQVINHQELFESVSNYSAAIRREVQLVFRNQLEALTLDQILDDKTNLDKDLIKQLQSKFDDKLVVFKSIKLKDIILPGEMRELFNKVVQADKEAQANLIKRREETAATRSLLNTARLMENNPTLLRLKELETLENIIQKVNSINVTDGVGGLIDLIRINKDENSSK